MLRAIFSIFFTHSLFNEIDHVLKRENRAFTWSPALWATIYVLSTVVSHLSDRLARFGELGEMISLASFALVVPMTWSLWVAQRAANVADDDPAGETNSRLTGANVVWLVLGGLLWLMILLGLLAILMDPMLPE